jgi:hypothetical protein
MNGHQLASGTATRSGASVAFGCPTLTLSIDLDQRWGLRSELGPSAHRVDSALLHTAELVHRMLVALVAADINATWFIPAAVTCGSWDEYFAVSPDDPAGLDGDQRITTAHRDMDPTGRLHFLPAVIEELLTVRGHEIGTTGFSGLPLYLPGVQRSDAIAEVVAAQGQIARATGRTVRAMAFPMDHAAHIDEIAAVTGIQRFRTSTTSTVGLVGRQLAAAQIGRNIPSLFRAASRNERAGLAARGVSTVDHDVKMNHSSMRWDRELRAIGRGCSNIAVGDSLHLRWSTRPPLGHDFDVDGAIGRFVSLLDTLRAGAERSSASIVPMDRLAGPTRTAA